MILFIDIDGVLIPRRAYYMANQTRPFVTKFDPSVVGMMNTLARENGFQFVIHSSWLRSIFLETTMGISDVKAHMIAEGLDAEAFHPDPCCVYTQSGDRWLAITEWLARHTEVGREDYWIIDDDLMPMDCQLNKARFINTNFDEGMTFEHFWQMRYSALGGAEREVLGGDTPPTVD